MASTRRRPHIITKNFTDTLDLQAASEVIRKTLCKTKPGVTNMCDTQRSLKKNRNTTKGKEREINKKIKKIKEAKQM